MLAGTAIAGVDVLDASFMRFYFKSDLPGHDDIADVLRAQEIYVAGYAYDAKSTHG